MNESWTGHRGIQREDVVMAMSSEPIVDRSKEHLVAADQAVVRLRRRMMDAIHLTEAGEPPPGLLMPDLTKVLASDQDMVRDARWQDIAAAHFELAPAAE